MKIFNSDQEAKCKSPPDCATGTELSYDGQKQGGIFLARQGAWPKIINVRADDVYGRNSHTCLEQKIYMF